MQAASLKIKLALSSSNEDSVALLTVNRRKKWALKLRTQPNFISTTLKFLVKIYWAVIFFCVFFVEFKRKMHRSEKILIFKRKAKGLKLP